MRVSVEINAETVARLARVQHNEGRSRSCTISLLLLSGLRLYDRGHSLMCGYPDCRRRGCCSKVRQDSALLQFTDRIPKHK